MKLFLLFLAASSVAAAEPILETYANKAAQSILAGDIQAGMTQIRVGFNCAGVKRQPASDDCCRDLLAKAEAETDKRKKAALLVVHSLLLLAKGGAAKADAWKLLDIAARLDETLPEIYNTRAVLLMQNRQYQDALKDIDKAIALNKNHADAWANRSLLHLKTGDPDQAEKDYEQHQLLISAVYYKQ